MKRVLRFAAVNILGLGLLAAGMPLQAESRDARGQGNGDARYASSWSQAPQRDYGRGGVARDHGYNYRDNDRDRRDYRGGDRDGGRVYAAPNYYANGYAYPSGGYYQESHAGRTAAIIGGTAAAGAVIGAAAGHGQGAAIGAVVGGVAGVIASQAINHHDYR